MAKKEITVEEKLKQLYELQLIDSKIDEIEILKGELPMEVSDLEDDLVGLEKRVTVLEENIAGIEKEISNHQANIKESENLQIRYQKQLDDVKNNREFDALTKELEIQKLEIQLSEKKIREAQVKADAKKELLKTNQEKVIQKAKDLENKKVELEKIIKKTDKEEKALLKKSEAAKEGIEERILKAYQRIRSTYRNGLSVVTVERDSCGGCYNKIPPQLQLEISMRKKVLSCEHCGRILVDNVIAGISEEVES